MTAITLASASRSRAAVLGAACVPFVAKPSGVDEELLKTELLAGGASPAEIAERLAAEKAVAISRLDEGIVIGADQTLELDGVLYDKTHDLAATRRRLEMLRGRTHELHAAVALAESGQIVWRCLRTARLTMRRFSDAYLEGYLARHGEAVASSVGAYHLEGEGSQLFEAIEGDYFTILGLPLIDLLAALRSRGALAS